MIYSIRGTSGSGKTHCAMRVLREPGVYGPPVPMHTAPRDYPPRSRPLWYARQPLPHVHHARPIAVLGSYESATGGCDTISGNHIPFELVRWLHPTHDVFFEGLLMSMEQHRTRALHTDGYPLRIFFFDQPLEECMAGVDARRAARGNHTPITADKDVGRRWHSIGAHRAWYTRAHPNEVINPRRDPRGHPQRFKEHGVHVTVGDRAAAALWLHAAGLVAYP